MLCWRHRFAGSVPLDPPRRARAQASSSTTTTRCDCSNLAGAEFRPAARTATELPLSARTSTGLSASWSSSSSSQPMLCLIRPMEAQRQRGFVARHRPAHGRPGVASLPPRIRKAGPPLPAARRRPAQAVGQRRQMADGGLEEVKARDNPPRPPVRSFRLSRLSRRSALLFRPPRRAHSRLARSSLSGAAASTPAMHHQRNRATSRTDFANRMMISLPATNHP